MFLRRTLRANNTANSFHRFLSHKVFPDAKSAVADIADGSKLCVGGFGVCGLPENLIEALSKQGAKDLVCVSNNAGLDDAGLGEYLHQKKEHSIPLVLRFT